MNTVCELARAKLNLALDVGALRPDGYHEMRMLMQSITLCDRVILRLDAGRWWAGGSDALPHDERNLALRAARQFCRAAGISSSGIEITLEKHIPTCAGLGGGSADAAAVLRALQKYYEKPLSPQALLDTAAEIGSDVPFCLVGGTMLAEGRGERLRPIAPLPQCDIVLCQPDFASPTPALFRALDAAPPAVRPDFPRLMAALPDLPAFAGLMENVFEPLLTMQHPQLGQIRRTLLEHGALGAMLTGTGSVMFGLFNDPAAAERARAALAQQTPWTAIAHPCTME